MNEVDPNESAIMRGRFGVNWRSWATFRDQWTKLSISVVSALGVIIVAIGGWAATLKTRVIVLETEVAPILRESKVESNNSTRLDSLEGRVKRLESNLDLDLNERLRAAAEIEARESSKDGKK